MIKIDENLIPIQKRFAKSYFLKEALAELGNPQKNILTINVVGTNGKGSVATGLSQGLQAKYKRVGLFISPAFLYHNERICINQIPIADADLRNYLFQNKPLIAKYQLTFFEIWTLIMIQYFVDQKVEIAVVEAGIGGLHDATSLMTNQLLVALTAVSEDHTALLGTTLEAIITQKIGISQPQTPLFSSIDNFHLAPIIINEANKRELFLHWGDYLPDPVTYQGANKGLIARILQYLDCPLPHQFQWPLGRYSILQTKPWWILDGAHNVGGVSALITALQKDQKKPLILYASSQDKDYYGCLALLNQAFPDVYVTSFDHPKAWKIPEALGKQKVTDWKAFLWENRNKDLVICGSLYFIPQVYEWWQSWYKGV